MGDAQADRGRFSGVPETEYREKWRKAAKAYLFGLPDNVPARKYGSKLAQLLSGEAEQITKHIEIGAQDPADELGIEGSEDRIFRILDERWPRVTTATTQTWQGSRLRVAPPSVASTRATGSSKTVVGWAPGGCVFAPQHRIESQIAKLSFLSFAHLPYL